MKNIKVKEIKKGSYYVVIADSERFGKQEIMFEGISFEECAAWIKANTKAQKKALWAVPVKCECTKAISWVCVRSQDRRTAFNRVWRMGYNNGYLFYTEVEIA